MSWVKSGALFGAASRLHPVILFIIPLIGRQIDEKVSRRRLAYSSVGRSRQVYLLQVDGVASQEKQSCHGKELDRVILIPH